ncbi:MAG: SGNH/GDSL hydrolase family protein [Magnetococcales bacterium]|nr:SGNH/GDSL hydrolase family protein [Magnetococcales bacterium]
MSWIKKLLFLTIGILVPLLVGVVILELLFGSWWRVDPWEAANRLNIIRDRHVVYQVGNLYGSGMESVVYSRDAHGVRGRCKGSDRIRILSVGGSTTDQRYIGDGQTFQDGLQERLEKLLRHPVCIANVGVDGHSTFGHLAAFDHWFPLIPDLKPAYVLFYIGINDAGFRDQPNAGFDDPTGRREGVWAVIKERSAIFRAVRKLSFVFTGLYTKKAYAGHDRRPPTPEAYTETSRSPGVEGLIDRHGAAFRARLTQLLEKTRALGAKPICVTQPHRFVMVGKEGLKGTANVFEHEGRSYNGLDYAASLQVLNGVMRTLCPQAGGAFIDIAAQPFELGDFYDPVHLPPTGAGRLGGYLFDAFVAQGLVAGL